MSELHPDCPICRAPGPLGEALAAGATRFAVSADHGQFHLQPGAAQAFRLTSGSADPLLPLIAQGDRWR